MQHYENEPARGAAGEDIIYGNLPVKCLHTKARTEGAKGYPERFKVTDEQTSWDCPFPGYAPQRYVAPSVLAKSPDRDDLDKPENRGVLMAREFLSHEGPVRRDENEMPLNPGGRTGLTGRGLLYAWGCNFTADPLVTRNNPETGKLEMLVILRDNGKWAMPGGFVDEGENIDDALARELEEETTVKLDFRKARIGYQGYVDDTRNTDNAWIETTCKRYHLSTEEAATCKPDNQDDALGWQWLEINDENLNALNANHGEMVRRAL